MRQHVRLTRCCARVDCAKDNNSGPNDRGNGGPRQWVGATQYPVASDPLILVVFFEA